MTSACPTCQKKIENLNAKFCEHCGSKLIKPCPQCGTELTLSAKFCPDCGCPLNGDANSSPSQKSAQTADGNFIKNSTVDMSTTQTTNTAQGANLGGSIENRPVFNLGSSQPDVKLFECPICGRRKKSD